MSVEVAFVTTFWEKELSTWLTISFLKLVCPFVNLAISYFVFEGRIVVLIAPDSGHCFLLTFYFLVLTKSIVHVFVDDLGLRPPTCQGH